MGVVLGPGRRIAAAEMRLDWAEPALLDLAAARDYIGRDDPAAAQRQMERVLSAVARLARFPELGRPGRHAGTREVVVARTPFIVAYRVRAGSIDVLRVLHSRRRWPGTL
ncbi:MAG: type II toxin-antitoxin system RelE/ParE family toxin [Pseudomonadota bacterium]|nr:type II toxin-antitoxin system RelE/ParE family toxin [Pseudomonadota bacterium]